MFDTSLCRNISTLESEERRGFGKGATKNQEIGMSLLSQLPKSLCGDLATLHYKRLEWGQRNGLGRRRKKLGIIGYHILEGLAKFAKTRNQEWSLVSKPPKILSSDCSDL